MVLETLVALHCCIPTCGIFDPCGCITCCFPHHFSVGCSLHVPNCCPDTCCYGNSYCGTIWCAAPFTCLALDHQETNTSDREHLNRLVVVENYKEEVKKSNFCVNHKIKHNPIEVRHSLEEDLKSCVCSPSCRCSPRCNPLRKAREMSSLADLDQEQESAEDKETRWIESEWHAKNSKDDRFADVDENDGFMSDMFADPDPYDTFNLTFPSNNDDKSNTPCVNITLRGIKAENGQTLDSTGLTLWRASYQLCDYMVKHVHFLQNKRILELGAGLGLCGLVAHKLGAETVVMTDGDTDTLSAMRKNVAQNITCQKNQNQVECRQLEWDHKKANQFRQRRGTFDLILGSDIIYVEQIIEPLFATVLQLLSNSKESQFWLAYARRNVSIDLVLKEARRVGLQWTEPVESEGVFIFTRQGDLL